jgi:hypothetical protein
MAQLVISYAREDRHIVRSLVQLLRGAILVQGAVFWDEEFTPGKEWAEQFRHEIDKAPERYVFWCSHSATSEDVSAEVAYALDRGKLVVPVLLDDTPLNESVSRRQGIDVRGVVNHDRGALTGIEPADAVRSDTLAKDAPLAVGVAMVATMSLQRGLVSVQRVGCCADDRVIRQSSKPASGALPVHHPIGAARARFS